jgi:hypothetical protein
MELLNPVWDDLNLSGILVKEAVLYHLSAVNTMSSHHSTDEFARPLSSEMP